MKTTGSLVGAAGEYYVLSRLCLADYIAAPAPKGVPNTDIVATDIEGTRLFNVQVKTRLKKGGDCGWPMNAKHERIVSKDLFYCFVDFSAGVKVVPKIFVVPAATVATALRECHQIWLRRLGKGGRAHQDSEMRKFRPDYSIDLGDDCPAQYRSEWLKPYEEAWGLLERSPAK